MRTLYQPAGLERQAVYWRSVLEGDRSTAPHTHDKTDEWVFVLAGRAIVHVGDARFEAGPNDFIGHPAGSDPHFMEAVTETTPGNGT